MQIEQNSYTLETADTDCVPGYTEASLRNLSPGEPAFLFLANEPALHRKLGIYEVRS